MLSSIVRININNIYFEIVFNNTLGQLMKSRINTLFKLYIVDTTNHMIEKKNIIIKSIDKIKRTMTLKT